MAPGSTNVGLPLVTDAAILFRKAVEGTVAIMTVVARQREELCETVEEANYLLDALIGPLNEASMRVERISRERIVLEKCAGESMRGINIIKHNLNNCINILAAGAKVLSWVAMDRRLPTREDAPNY
jgi:hypothetical protein